MKNRANVIRFPGSFRDDSAGCECGVECHDFESWEVYEEFLKNEDYQGLVVYCKREVSLDPENLHAWERLGEAYVLSGRFREAIEAMGEVHRWFPDIESFQYLILDALCALGKNEHDYDWVRDPCVLRIGPAVLDECWKHLRRKRKPRWVADLYFELMLTGYLTFSDEDLLEALSGDERFIVEIDRNTGEERIWASRKRGGGTSANRKR